VGTDDVEAYLNAIPSLERVVVPPEPVEAQAEGGGRRIITSVEIWSNGVVIRTADIAVDPIRPPASDWLSQGQMTDSGGQNYRFIEGWLVGDELVRFGYALYTPKPPEDAQLLSVRLPMTHTYVWIPLNEG
jgi:hypothetical protein